MVGSYSFKMILYRDHFSLLKNKILSGDFTLVLGLLECLVMLVRYISIIDIFCEVYPYFLPSFLTLKCLLSRLKQWLFYFYRYGV